jgi:hypothetical protein
MSATVWAYPWDLVDEGVARAADAVAALGLDGIRMASAYHSGKFISPRSAHRRVVFPEGGVIYFRPRGTSFQGLAIQPVLSQLLKDGDPLEDVVRECHRRGMTATAWMVLAHNTRLAQRYPDCQVRNAFGDRYAYCLCPAQTATRDYILALITELADGYDVDAVELESPGYLGFMHGYHHEFYGPAVGLVEQCLLALCFCPACERLLREEGIDPQPLKARVREAVDRGIGGDAADASRIEEIFRQDAELWALVTKRVETVTALVGDIAGLVHTRGKKLFCFGPVFVQPASLDWVEGTDARRIAPLADCWELALYSPDQSERVAIAQRAASLGLPCQLGAGINAGATCTRDAADLVSAALAAKNAGIQHVAFYNYGVLPQERLAWLAEAAAAFRS